MYQDAYEHSSAPSQYPLAMSGLGNFHGFGAVDPGPVGAGGTDADRRGLPTTATAPIDIYKSITAGVKNTTAAIRKTAEGAKHGFGFEQELIDGLPNWMLYSGAGLALAILMVSGKK